MRVPRPPPRSARPVRQAPSVRDRFDPEEEYLESAPKPRHRRRARKGWVWWGLIPAIALAAVVVVGFLLILIAPAPGARAVLVPAGESENVSSGSYWYVAFALTQHEHVSGGFSATSNVWAYMLDQAEFENISPNGTPAKGSGSSVLADWSSGNVTAAKFSLGLSTGDWYLDFVDPPRGSYSIVTISSSIVATT